jgi:hypothetical protein
MAKGHVSYGELSRIERGKTKNQRVAGICNCINNFGISILCIQFTNTAAGRKIQPGGLRFGDP